MKPSTAWAGKSLDPARRDEIMPHATQAVTRVVRILGDFLVRGGAIGHRRFPRRLK